MRYSIHLIQPHLKKNTLMAHLFLINQLKIIILKTNNPSILL